MTKAKPIKPPAVDGPDNTFNVQQTKDEKPRVAVARSALGPDFRHACATSQIMKPLFGKLEGAPGFADYAAAIGANADMAAKGDLAFASRMLAAQAVTLDTIFTETARRMASNMGEHLGAMEIYARIALKAQAHSRATLEALGKLHQPREQTVRHVHVNEGGQAVIAGQFHHHAGGTGNGQSAEQPHATGNGAVGTSPTLPSPDPLGHGVPIPCRERKRPVSNARRQRQWGSGG